jgi:guanylate cyclase
MESHSVPGRIQLSRGTYEQVKDLFKLEPRGKITVKGKGELETWFVAEEQSPGSPVPSAQERHH